MHTSKILLMMMIPVFIAGIVFAQIARSQFLAKEINLVDPISSSTVDMKFFSEIDSYNSLQDLKLAFQNFIKVQYQANREILKICGAK